PKPILGRWVHPPAAAPLRALPAAAQAISIDRHIVSREQSDAERVHASPGRSAQPPRFASCHFAGECPPLYRLAAREPRAAAGRRATTAERGLFSRGPALEPHG